MCDVVMNSMVTTNKQTKKSTLNLYKGVVSSVDENRTKTQMI